MLKKFLFGLLLVGAITGCSKDDGCNVDPCDVQAPPSEVQAVEAYLASQNITNAIKHCSGLYYIIDTAGTGSTISPCNSVTATYVGTLTNGTQFDARQASFSLTGVIRGWTVGVPLVKEGGTIRLFIPPSLGYGNQAAGSTIPPNSILLFTVKVDDVY